MTRGIFELFPLDLLDVILYDLPLEDLYFSYIIFKATNRPRTQRLWEYLYKRNISSLRLPSCDYQARYKTAILEFNVDPIIFSVYGYEHLYERSQDYFNFAQISIAWNWFRTVIDNSCSKNYPDILDRLLTDFNFQVESMFFREALDEQNIEILRVFDSKAPFDWSEQLVIAAACYNRTVIDRLLEHNINDAICYSIRFNHHDLAKYLWSKLEPLPEAPDRQKILNHILGISAEASSFELIFYFLNQGATNIDEALVYSLGSESKEILEFLHQKGARLNPENCHIQCHYIGWRGNVTELTFFRRYYQDHLDLKELIRGSVACRKKEFFLALIDLIEDPYYVEKRREVEEALKICDLKISLETYIKSLGD